MIKFDMEKEASWQDIANVILKAAEKEEIAREMKVPSLKPDANLHPPFEKFKECVSCCKYLQEDMQTENILDKYELRQDTHDKDRVIREKTQKILDINHDNRILRQMRFPCFNVKLSSE